MKYQYIDKDPEAGDVVLWVSNTSKESIYIEYNKPYLVKQIDNCNLVEIIDKHGNLTKLGSQNRKVIKTKPGHEAKVGDTCIRISVGNSDKPNGSTIVVSEITKNGNLGWDKIYSNHPSQFLVLCQEPEVIQDTPYSDIKLYSREYYEYWDKQYHKGAKLVFHTEEHRKNNVKFAYSKQNNPNSPLDFYDLHADEKAKFEFAENQPTENQSQQQKETHMNLQDTINEIFGVTDYQMKPKFVVVVYNAEGSEIATTTAESLQDVTDKVQSTPKLWGCKLVMYKMNKEVTTEVPVAVTKL